MWRYYLSHVETKIYSILGAFCLRQNAQRAALRAAGQATSGKILLICNFHPSRARNYTTTIISKLDNFAEVLAVRVHVDVYMVTPALRSLTHETLCDTGQWTADTLKFTNHHLPITKSLHFKPSILVFFVASPQKNIDGKNIIYA